MQTAAAAVAAPSGTSTPAARKRKTPVTATKAPARQKAKQVSTLKSGCYYNVEACVASTKPWGVGADARSEGNEAENEEEDVEESHMLASLGSEAEECAEEAVAEDMDDDEWR